MNKVTRVSLGLNAITVLVLILVLSSPFRLRQISVRQVGLQQVMPSLGSLTGVQTETVQRVLQPWEIAYADNCGAGIPSQYRWIFYTSGYGCGVIQTTAYIIHEESSWNPNIPNPDSTAYGLGQYLDSTWPECQARGYWNKYNYVDQLNCTLRMVSEGHAYDTWFKWWPANKRPF